VGGSHTQWGPVVAMEEAVHLPGIELRTFSLLPATLPAKLSRLVQPVTRFAEDIKTIYSFIICLTTIFRLHMLSKIAW
jgi:hypothetical protein